MKTLFNVLVICSFLFIAGCQSGAISTENAIVPASTSAIATSLPTEDNGGIDMSDPNAQKMVQLAKESMARKFKISEDQVHLASVEAMVWPDDSLGCPRPGIIYAQVMTPGFQILLEAVGQSASYHTDDTNRVILCRIHPTDEIFLTP